MERLTIEEKKALIKQLEHEYLGRDGAPLSKLLRILQKEVDICEKRIVPIEKKEKKE
jgi:hypothetical protein